MNVWTVFVIIKLQHNTLDKPLDAPYHPENVLMCRCWMLQLHAGFRPVRFIPLICPFLLEPHLTLYYQECIMWCSIYMLGYQEYVMCFWTVEITFPWFTDTKPSSSERVISNSSIIDHSWKFFKMYLWKCSNYRTSIFLMNFNCLSVSAKVENGNVKTVTARPHVVHMATHTTLVLMVAYLSFKDLVTTLWPNQVWTTHINFWLPQQTCSVAPVELHVLKALNLPLEQKEQLLSIAYNLLKVKGHICLCFLH